MTVHFFYESRVRRNFKPDPVNRALINLIFARAGVNGVVVALVLHYQGVVDLDSDLQTVLFHCLVNAKMHLNFVFVDHFRPAWLWRCCGRKGVVITRPARVRRCYAYLKTAFLD